MCEACLAECEDLGEIVPGLFLVRALKTWKHIQEGYYGLVRSNDPDLVWEVRPAPDPCEGMTDEEIDEAPDTLMQGFFVWDNQVGDFVAACRDQLDMTTAYRIGKLCEAAGYNMEEDGFLEHWLFHRMGVLLAKPPQPQES